MLSKETYKFGREILWLLDFLTKIPSIDKLFPLKSLMDDAFSSLLCCNSESRAGKRSIGDEPRLSIRIISDKINKTLTIWDSGTGMTRQNLIENLSFDRHLAKLTSVITLELPMDLILQQISGFHSAFLLTNKIQVISRYYESEQYICESEGGETFTIEEDKVNERIPRGTKVILYLKEDHLELLEENTIQKFVDSLPLYNFPIELLTTTTDPKARVKGEEVKRSMFKVITKKIPIWMEYPSKISKEDYDELYKSLAGDEEGYLDVKHFIAEGSLEYNAIFYIPKKAYNSQAPEYTIDARNVKLKLYARGKFVLDNCDFLLPDYLWFLKGVVNSQDIPTNFDKARSIESKIFRVMRRNNARKCIEMFNELSKNEEAYNHFYALYNKNIKLGIHEDENNRERLLHLLRYKSSKSEGKLISLETYISRMKKGQNEIYYIIGKSEESIKDSPSSEIFKKLDYEVLYLIDPIDEYIIKQKNSYQGHRLRCSIEGEEEKEAAEGFIPIYERIKEELKGKIDKVTISTRHTDYPCIIVENTISAVPEIILEINIYSDAVIELKREIDEGTNDNTIRDLIQQLYASAKCNIELDKQSATQT